MPQYFADYRLRIAAVSRDYGIGNGTEVPRTAVTSTGDNAADDW